MSVAKQRDRVFWARLERRTTGCWEWPGATFRRGYGYVRRDGKVWYAHRLAYTLAKGDIPEGMYVCHSCDNPLCCNPDHLWLGQPIDNTHDAARKDRMPHKLSRADVQRIRELHQAGQASPKKLAEQYGVRRATIYDILNHRTRLL